MFPKIQDYFVSRLFPLRQLAEQLDLSLFLCVIKRTNQELINNLSVQNNICKVACPRIQSLCSRHGLNPEPSASKSNIITSNLTLTVLFMFKVIMYSISFSVLIFFFADMKL